MPLHDAAAVEYRHEVLRDLENPGTAGAVTEFAKRMRAVRENLALAGKLRYRYQRESWFLSAARRYCVAAGSLAAALGQAELASTGLTALRGYLGRYVTSAAFTGLADEASGVAGALDGVTYCVNIKGPRVTVTRYEEEANFSADVVATFERFARGAGKDYRGSLRNWPEMDHVEEWIADRVAKLFPAEFAALDDFCAGHGGFEDETVTAFDREIQFYLFVMNESFASTTLRDATFIGERVIDTMTGLGVLGVYVTFIDELASSTAACVSMVGTVKPDDPAERTYKVVRRPADGLAYAEAIARKYRLTYPQLTERIASLSVGAA
jgi:hypothetical protein